MLCSHRTTTVESGIIETAPNKQKGGKTMKKEALARLRESNILLAANDPKLHANRNPANCQNNQLVKPFTKSETQNVPEIYKHNPDIMSSMTEEQIQQRLTGLAVDALEDILQNPDTPDNVKLSTARYVIDRVLGAPTQRTETKSESKSMVLVLDGVSGLGKEVYTEEKLVKMGVIS